MKRLFLFATAFFLYSVTNAQHVEFGLKAGLNVANLSDVNNNAAVVAPHGGVLAHIHFTEHFALQPEFVLSGQGTSYKQNNTIRLNLGYINIPVLFQYMVGNGFRLETGPQFGLMPFARQRIGSSSTSVKDNFKSGDFGWAFGLGYLTKSNWGVDARYNLGLTDIGYAAGNQRNGVFQFGVFYQFHKH